MTSNTPNVLYAVGDVVACKRDGLQGRVVETTKYSVVIAVAGGTLSVPNSQIEGKVG